jgi:hypothetical protein
MRRNVWDEVSRQLDRLTAVDVSMGGHRVSAFRVFGVAGFVVGSVASASLAVVRGLSPGVVGLLAFTAAATFLLLVVARKLISGNEPITHFHHQVAVGLACAGVLTACGLPVLRYLDLVAVGFGIFVAFARFGCLGAGCCHGRPARLGVRYGRKHVEGGFPRYLQNVRVFPIQALEAVWALSAAGAALECSAGEQEGLGVAAYVAAYAGGRFVFEYVRGDPDRPYFLGLSEAQWTSVALLAAIAIVGSTWALPWSAAFGVAAAAVGITAAASLIRSVRSEGSERTLLQPRHLEELAEAVQHLSYQAAQTASAANSPTRAYVHIASTSLALRVSVSTVVTDTGALHHYALSWPRGLTRNGAEALGRVVSALVDNSSNAEVVNGPGGVFHLAFFHPTRRQYQGV